jgi:hypothetical protein
MVLITETWFVADLVTYMLWLVGLYAIPKGLTRMVSSKISSTAVFVTLFIIETAYGPLDNIKRHYL